MSRKVETVKPLRDRVLHSYSPSINYLFINLEDIKAGGPSRRSYILCVTVSTVSFIIAHVKSRQTRDLFMNTQISESK